MSDEIKAGVIVMVASGGPRMTVTHVEDRYGIMTAWCTWFEKGKKFEDTFAVASLKVVT
jgi:uncharacterized protein YodC (DUF2158 family)